MNKKTNTYQLKIMFYLLKYSSFKKIKEVMEGDTNTKPFRQAIETLINEKDIKTIGKEKRYEFT